MESDANILDELNLTIQSNHLSKSISSRKESLFLSCFIFIRHFDRVVEKRIVLTNRYLYFLRRRLACWCGSSSGLTFASKIPVTEFIELTIDSARRCVVLHCNKIDDVFLQVTQRVAGEDFVTYDHSLNYVSNRVIAMHTDDASPDKIKPKLKIILHRDDDMPTGGIEDKIADDK